MLLIAADGNVTITYEFGDGVSIDFVATKIFSYIYLEAGFYKLTVSAKQEMANAVAVSDSRIVHVETKPYGLNINVPNVLETEIQYNLTASIVEGNNMTVDASISIGATQMTGTGFTGLSAEGTDNYLSLFNGRKF